MVQLPTSHLGAGEKVYPLGLSRLSALVPETVDKKVLDMNISLDPWQALKHLLDDYQPDIVALSFRNLDPLAGHQASYLSSLKTAALLVRSQTPAARILAGGPAFSLFAKRLMQEVPQIDFGLIGEGEQIFNTLLTSTVTPEILPGIIWRKDDQIMVNPGKEKTDMNCLPTPDYSSFPPSDYVKANTYVAAMGIEGKRGCDLWCGYCLYPYLGGTCMRLRAPEKIADDMAHLSKNWGVRLFHFTDSVVNRPADHFEAVCRELIRRDLNVSWTGFFREDTLTPHNLDLAMKAGLIAIYFSADALNRKGLALMNKRLTPEQILDAAQLTADRKILTMSHFLVNLPGETDTDIEESWQMLNQLLAIHAPAANLGAVIFNHVRLYPGAPLTRYLIRTGALDPDADLLYPVYHNPEKYSHVLHDFEALCHSANIFSRLEMPLPAPFTGAL